MEVIVLIAILLIIFFSTSIIEKKVAKMSDTHSEIKELLREIKDEIKNK